MSEVKIYGKNKIEEAAKKMIREGAEIMPTDEREVFFVATNPELIMPIGYFEIEGIGIFIGHKRIKIIDNKIIE